MGCKKAIFKGMRPWRVIGSFTLCLAFFSVFWLFLSDQELDTWDSETLPNDSFYSGRFAVPRPLPVNLKGRELAFHQIFEPRIVSFDGYPKGIMKDNSTKIILLWTPWNGVKQTINYYFLQEGTKSFTSYGCPNTHCTVTWDRTLLSKADAVLFNIRDMPTTNYRDIPERPRENPHQRWIGYILEAPWLCKMDWSKFDGLFNWTMSYREDSDIVVKYGFVGRRNPEEPTAIRDLKVPFSEKKSVVWFVSDCKTDSRREEYVKELQKYIDVDIFGKCGDKHCYPSQSSVCYGDVLIGYKFYLSFENSLCKDYVTEKFFNILEYDVIPVVFGGAAYEKIAPNGSYINAMLYQNPKDLSEHLKLVGSNQKSYRRYFKWKNTHRAYLHPWTCSLCDKLHEPLSRVTNAKTHLKEWWIDQAKCKRWTDLKFVPSTF